MPDVLTDGTRFAVGFAAVGLLAGTGYLAVRKSRLPGLAPWRPAWSGADVVLLSVLYVAGPSLILALLTALNAFGTAPPAPELGILLGGPASAVAEQATRDLHFLRTSAASFAFLPAFLGVAVYSGLRMPARSDVRAGIRAWAVLTPATFVAHFAAVGLLGEPDDHPLTKVGVRESPLLAVLLFAQACAAAPLYEELIFRRFLLPWAVPRGPGTELRPALLVLLAVFVTVARGGGAIGPVVFAVALVAGYVLLFGVRRVSKRYGGRTAFGIYSTASLFAGLHAAVWPSPIPLLVLGTGLGWLAVRTRGVAAPVIAHGLFNAVSAVVVLRGPG